MKAVALGFVIASALFGQQFVQYTPSAPLTSTVSVVATPVPFVMPCGATSYTAYSGPFLTCSANYPTNSSFSSHLAGATDWARFTGQGANRITLRKKVASHRISDITILPTSAQPVTSTFALGYYMDQPYETEDYDFGDPTKLPPAYYGTPYWTSNVSTYVNCYASGALVSNCGESLTVPVVPGVKQTYYFYVGAIGGINGTFRIHLSDGTADYVATDTDAATGTATSNGTQTEKLFTVQMQSATSGVTATVSYTGANLIGGASSGYLGFMAVSMGGQTSGAANPVVDLPQTVNNGLGDGIYGAQVTVPDSSVIPRSGSMTFTTINVPHVNPSTDLASYQAAYNCAVGQITGTNCGLGGRYDIVLADGFTSSGTIMLYNPAGRDNNWIETRCAVLPQKPSGGGDVSYGQRPNPSNTDGSPVDVFHCHMNSNTNGDAIILNDAENATLARRAVHHVDFIGIDIGFTSVSASAPMYAAIAISPFSNNYPDSVHGITTATYPHHILFERCWIHGIVPSDGNVITHNAISGLVINYNYAAVYDSYFNWFYQTGGPESKAMWSNASAGPITIRNTHIEADTEGWICCAQSQATVGHTALQNMQVDHNYYTKNRAEMATSTLEKNHHEWKGCEGCTVSDNVFENSWSNSQQGQCIALNSHLGQPADLGLGLANILVERNYCHSGAGISINLSEELNMGRPLAASQVNVSKNVMIRNNYFFISGTQATRGQSVTGHACFGFGGIETGVDVTLDHNTCYFDPADDDDPTNRESFSWTSSISSNPPSGALDQLARRARFHFTNNEIPRQPTGNSTAHYGLLFYGWDMQNNNFGRYQQATFTNSGGAYVGLSTDQRSRDLGYSYYWAQLPTSSTGVGGFAGLGNPRKVLNLGTNYFEGCKIDVFASSGGVTCTPPPALTYPNPVRGADIPTIFGQYCSIKWGNRSDLVTSQGCTTPVH